MKTFVDEQGLKHGDWCVPSKKSIKSSPTYELISRNEIIVLRCWGRSHLLRGAKESAKDGECLGESSEKNSEDLTNMRKLKRALEGKESIREGLKKAFERNSIYRESSWSHALKEGLINQSLKYQPVICYFT